MIASDHLEIRKQRNYVKIWLFDEKINFDLITENSHLNKYFLMPNNITNDTIVCLKMLGQLGKFQSTEVKLVL